MLVGQRAQALRQQRPIAHPQRELAHPGAHRGAIHADPVAAIEVGEIAEGARVERVTREYELEGGGLVLQVGENEPAVSADEHQAAGDAHRGVALAARLEPAELVADLGECVVAVEAVRGPGACRQPLLLCEPLRALLGDEVAGNRLGGSFRRGGGFTARVHADIVLSGSRVRQGRQAF
jgi:hypothetical protein